MKVVRKSCAEGVLGVKGTAVVIDVFRAFSCAPLFFHFGAKRVILEADPEKAVYFKKANPEFVFVGEVNAVPIEGADLGNSPTHIIKKGRGFWNGRTVIHRTTAGVTGATTALETADQVILGAFVTAGAIAAYVLKNQPKQVTLVAMGDRAIKKAPEDEACADYLEHLLTGASYDPVHSFEKVVFQPTAQRFLMGAEDYLPREDPVFCLQKNLFDFVLTARRVENYLEVFQM